MIAILFIVVVVVGLIVAVAIYDHYRKWASLTTRPSFLFPPPHHQTLYPLSHRFGWQVVMVKSLPPPTKVGSHGGMAERLKAHVLKTCLVKANVGSNPTPSALQFGYKPCTRRTCWRFLICDYNIKRQTSSCTLLGRCQSGWMGSPAKWVPALKPVAGSNPALSATKHTRFSGVFLFSGRAPPLRGRLSNPALSATKHIRKGVFLFCPNACFSISYNKNGTAFYLQSHFFRITRPWSGISGSGFRKCRQR